MAKKFRKIVEKDGTEYYVEVGRGDRGLQGCLKKIVSLYISCWSLMKLIQIILLILIILGALLGELIF